MLSSVLESNTKRLIIQRNIIFISVVLLFLIDLLLSASVYALRNKSKVILLPPNSERVLELSESDVSDEYLSEMTEYFTGLVLNVSPGNLSRRHRTILRHAEPQYYGVLKGELLQRGEKIQRENMSTTFYPVKIYTDKKNINAIISGDLSVFVGRERISNERKSFKMEFMLNNGRLSIAKFSEVKREV